MLQKTNGDLAILAAAFPELDLVEEMEWEELIAEGRIECITLEDAGLEEEGSEPVFGGFYGDSVVEHCSGGVYDYTNWLMDGELNLED